MVNLTGWDWSLQGLEILMGPALCRQGGVSDELRCGLPVGLLD